MVNSFLFVWLVCLQDNHSSCRNSHEEVYTSFLLKSFSMRIQLLLRFMEGFSTYIQYNGTFGLRRKEWMYLSVCDALSSLFSPYCAQGEIGVFSVAEVLLDAYA